jgi:hypothetical protein
MKILVYTGFDDNRGFRNFGIDSTLSKARYALKNNYDFLCTRDYTGYDRPISWFKIKKILELLPNYDYIFWSDADAVITNHAIRIEDIISKEIERPKSIMVSPETSPRQFSMEIPPLKSIDYVIAYDDYSPCMGNFIIRNCEWSMNFFSKIYEKTEFMNDPIWDNRAQDNLIYHDKSISEHIKYVPKKMINSFIYDWTRGDFLIHFPAISPERRVLLTREYMQKSIYT